MSWNIEKAYRDLVDLYNQAYGTDYTVVVTRKEVNDDDRREQRETTEA